MLALTAFKVCYRMPFWKVSSFFFLMLGPRFLWFYLLLLHFILHCLLWLSDSPLCGLTQFGWFIHLLMDAWVSPLTPVLVEARSPHGQVLQQGLPGHGRGVWASHPLQLHQWGEVCLRRGGCWLPASPRPPPPRLLRVSSRRASWRGILGRAAAMGLLCMHFPAPSSHPNSSLPQVVLSEAVRNAFCS